MVRATFVEIPVLDLDRAVHFYEQVFGCSTSRMLIDGHEGALIGAGTGAGAGADNGTDSDMASEGASIALMSGESYVPSLDGTRVYLTVADLSTSLKRAESLGGRVVYEITEVADGLRVAEIQDSEGNRIALSDR